MSDDSIALALAGVWALSGLAAVVLITSHGLRTLRTIRATRGLEQREKRAATLVASRLDALDVIREEQVVDMESEFVSEIEKWLRQGTEGEAV